MPDYQEITVTLPDGYTAYARWWPVPHPAGAVLYLHGIQSHSGWYHESAQGLQQAGYAVLQPDRRGSGRNDRERGHARDCGQLVEDAACCGRELCRRSGLPAYHVLGVSWGGKLACALAVQENRAVSGLTLACPGLFPRVDVTSGEKIRIGLSLFTHPRRLHDIPLNDPRLFTDQPRWIEFLEQDSLRLHQVTASFFLASRRMDRAVRAFSDGRSRPVHVLIAGLDEIVDAPRTACWARDLSWSQTRITHYPDGRHTLEFDRAFHSYCQDLIEGLQPDAAGRSWPLT